MPEKPPEPDRDASAKARRERRGRFCARGALDTPARGRSASPLDVVKSRIAILAAVPLLALCSALAQETIPSHTHKPYVPDAETAIRIALAVWEPIYGKKLIAAEKPYRAALNDGVWRVEGSLREGSIGGVARADISATDGTILRVTHGQ
jgi:hypothetical protein